MQHWEECSDDYTFEHIHDPSLAQIPASGLKSFSKCLIQILRVFLGACLLAHQSTLNLKKEMAIS